MAIRENKPPHLVSEDVNRRLDSNVTSAYLVECRDFNTGVATELSDRIVTFSELTSPINRNRQIKSVMDFCILGSQEVGVK